MPKAADKLDKIIEARIGKALDIEEDLRDIVAIFNKDYKCSCLGGLGSIIEKIKRMPGDNGGWRNTSFRGYADWMQTDRFASAVVELTGLARTQRTVIMCAEAVPWRCHRSLVADALVTCGWEVHHILSPDRVQIHRLTAFAVMQNDRLVYPAPADQDAPPRLF